MLRWIYKFSIILAVYGGLISFGSTFAKAFGSEPATFDEWDFYMSLILAFWGAFLDWKKML